VAFTSGGINGGNAAIYITGLALRRGGGIISVGPSGPTDLAPMRARKRMKFVRATERVLESARDLADTLEIIPGPYERAYAYAPL